METPEHLWLTQCKQLLEEFELFRAEIAGMRTEMRQGFAEINTALSGVEYQIGKIQQQFADAKQIRQLRSEAQAQLSAPNKSP